MATVIEEAGGCISDWHGQPVGGSDWDGSLVASATAQLHHQALAVLQGKASQEPPESGV
jgi:fructose-1,6-bisphosphatase/inositol monophosphatase family enzyme